MKKKMFGLVMAVLMAMNTAFPAMAMTAGEAAEAIAATDERITVDNDNGLCYTVDNFDDYDSLAMQSVNDALRYCSGAEFGDVTYSYTSDGRVRNTVPGSVIADLADEVTYVDAWLAEHMQAIVPDGTSRDDAIMKVVSYISSNYRYDYSAMDDVAYQGAAEMIRTGKGVCASFALLFRTIVEYVPFNSDGVVDWANGSVHIPVAFVIIPNVHGWAAIQSEDGTWRHYDLAKGVCRVPTSSVCAINRVSEDELVWYY